MEHRIRELELAVRADPSDAAAIRELVRLYDRMDRRFQGRTITAWVALIDDLWLDVDAFTVLIDLGPLALDAAPAAAAIERGAKMRAWRAAALLKAIGPAAAPVLIETYLKGAKVPPEWVIDCLGDWRIKAAIQPLCALRADAELPILLAIERALWRITGDHEPVLALLAALSEGQRARLADALAALAVELGPAAGALVPILLGIARSSGLRPRRLGEALVAIGPEDARLHSAMIELLGHPRGDRARIAAEVLGQLGPRARPVLLEALPRTRLKRRAAIVDALAAVGLDDASAEQVRLQLREKTRRLKVAAAEALGPERGGEEALAALIDALAYDDELAIRAAGAIARYAAAGRRAVPALLSELRSPDGARSRAAASALLTVASATPRFMRSYLSAVSAGRDPIEKRRRLARLGEASQRWVPALKARLSDRDPRIAIQAAHELIELLPHEEIGALVPALRRAAASEREVGILAMRLIAEGGAAFAEAAPSAFAFLEDGPGVFQRLPAIEALGALGPSASLAAPRLRAILGRGDLDSNHAASALLSIDPEDPQALDHFRARLGSGDHAVRIACQHLGGVGANAAGLLDELEALYRARDERGQRHYVSVRHAAVEAIQAIRLAVDRRQRGEA